MASANTHLTLAQATGFAATGAFSLAGNLKVGADGAGKTVTFYGVSTGSSVTYAADKLSVKSNVDVLGSLALTGASVHLTSSLAVTGNSALIGTLGVTGAVTVGANGSGNDLTLYGATAGSGLTWRAATNTLRLRGVLDLVGGVTTSANGQIDGELTVGGGASVGGELASGGGLTVGANGNGGDVTFYGASAGSAVKFAGDMLDVTAALMVSGDADITGTFTVQGNSDITAPATIALTAPTVSVAGAFTADGSADISGGASVGGSLAALGGLAVGADGAGADATLYGAEAGSYAQWDANTNALNVLGDASVTGAFAVVGSAGVTGDLDVTGAATVSESLDVSAELSAGGLATLSAGAALGGSLTVGTDGTGYDATLYGATSGSALRWVPDTDTLTVAGATVLDGATTTTGSVAVGGDLIAAGAATLASTLSVGDATTVGTDGAGADLTVHGATAGSSLAWDADTNKLTVSGVTATTGALGVGGALSVAGTAHLVGGATLGSTLTVAGTSALAGAVTVGASGAGVTTTLFGSGSGSFVKYQGASNTLTVNSALGMTGHLTMTGTADITGGLSATGAANLGSTLAMGGALTVSTDGVGAALKVHGSATGSMLHWDPAASALQVVGGGSFSSNVAMGAALNLAGKATVAGGLDVTAGGASVRGGLLVGATGASASVAFVGTAAGSGITFASDVLAIVAPTSITGATTLVGTFHTTGASTVTGSLRVTGPAVVTGDFSVASAASVSIAATSAAIAAPTTVTGLLTVGANQAGYRVILYGAASGSSMTWDSNTDTLRVVGALAVTGGVDVVAGSAGVTVSAATVGITSDVSVAGTADVSGELTVGGVLSLTSDLVGAGKATFGEDQAGADLQAFGDSSGSYVLWDASRNLLEVSGDLSVTASATVDGSLTVSATLTAGGLASLSAGAALGGDLTVGGAGVGHSVLLYGAASGSSAKWDSGANTWLVTGKSKVVGATTLMGTLGVTGATTLVGATTLTGTLAVSSTSQFNNQVSVGANGVGRTFIAYGSQSGSFVRWQGNTLTVNGGIDLAGDLTVDGELEISAPATLDDTLTVAGVSTFNDAIVVGEPGTGHDVTFYGQAAGSYWLWDRDSNSMKVMATNIQSKGTFVHTGTLQTTDAITAAGESHFVDLEVSGTLTISNPQRRRLAAARVEGVDGVEATELEDEYKGMLRRAEDFYRQEDGSHLWDPSRRLLAEDASSGGRRLQAATSLNIEGDVGFLGDLTVGGQVLFESSMVVQQKLTVDGQAEFNGIVYVKDRLEVTDEIDVGTDLTVGPTSGSGSTVTFFGSTSGSYFKWTAENNAASIFGTLSVQAGASGISHTIQGDLVLDGKLSTRPGKEVSVGGKLSVALAANFASDINSNGAFYTKLGATFGTTTQGRDVRMYGSTAGSSLLWSWGTNALLVSGAATVTGGVSLQKDVSVGGDLTVGGSLSLGGDVAFTGKLTVGAAGEAAADVAFFGRAVGSSLKWDAANSRLTVAGATVLAAATATTLTVAGTTATSVLTVLGASTLTGAVAVRGVLSTGLAGAGVAVTLNGASQGKSVRYAANTLSVLSDLDVVGLVAVTGATQLTGTLAVSAAATLTSTLAVRGAVTVGASGAGTKVLLYGNAAGSSLQWIADTNKLTVAGALAVSGPTALTGAVTVATRLIVASGGAAVHGPLDVSSGGLTVGASGAGQTFVVYGASAGSSLTFGANALTLRAALSVTGDATLVGTVSVLGAASFSGVLTAEVDAHIGGELTVVGGAAVTGASAFDSTLSVGGALTVGSDTDGADVTFYGTVAESFVAWDANTDLLHVSGTVRVDSKADFGADLEVGGSVLVSGGVTVAGLGAFDGGLHAGTAAQGADLIAYGQNGAAYMAWDASDNTLNIAGSLQISGDASFTGATQIGGQLLEVFAPANFSAPVHVTALLSVASAFTAQSTLAVGGGAEVAGLLAVSGGAALQGEVSLGGQLADDVLFAGAMARPRHRVHELATSPALACIFSLADASERYSVLLLNMTASRAAGCAWANVLMPLCEAADEGVSLSISAIGDSDQAMPVFAHDGDSSRLIITSETPTAADAAANAARIGANVFPIYGGDSGVALICSAAGQWQKVAGGAPITSTTLDVERLLIDTGDFDFIGGVNLNAIKDNSTNSEDLGDGRRGRRRAARGGLVARRGRRRRRDAQGGLVRRRRGGRDRPGGGRSWRQRGDGRW
ncbi:hypothetical protein T492DRAFT_1003562 [Pavlovales sp. CCMP2436]|nr:hypothetical protein T492DRAFT_1003562 [Pavlovales sp. CCMP2436]